MLYTGTTARYLYYFGIIWVMTLRGCPGVLKKMEFFADKAQRISLRKYFVFFLATPLCSVGDLLVPPHFWVNIFSPVCRMIHKWKLWECVAYSWHGCTECGSAARVRDSRHPVPLLFDLMTVPFQPETASPVSRDFDLLFSLLRRVQMAGCGWTSVG